MNERYYIGLDVHKKTIAVCVKEADGRVVSEETVEATREGLGRWVSGIDRPWIGGLESTLFSGWIYDFLLPHAEELKVAHPAMLKAIAASKKKTDRIDATKIADLVRCDLLPECYMAPARIRELRRVLRFRNLMVSQAVRLKNKTAGLLMEVGAPYNKKRLHGKRYFGELLQSLEDVPDSIREMLRLSRGGMELFERVQKRLLKALHGDPLLARRVEALTILQGVGEVTALTWALEVGEPERFSTINRAVSYCGLCSALSRSAGKDHRGPISKQRNKHLQTILIEAAKLAPRWDPSLQAVHERELKRGNKNRATLAVARRLVARLLAVDKRYSRAVQDHAVTKD